MKILLLGEYSRLHNTLKEGLLNLNHEVTLIGTGDGFKNYPVDINIKVTFFENIFLKFFVKVFYKLFNISLIQMESAYRFYKILPQLKGFDIVQLINENSIRTHPKLEVWLLKKLLKQNDKLYLLSCGTDYISVNYANDKKFKYSILTPLHNNPNLKKNYKYILNYITKPFHKLHTFLYRNIDGVIASDLDYHIPLKNHPKYLGLIPNPINVKKIKYRPIDIHSKINVFHGINRLNYIKKGNHFFEDALSIIQKKFPQKVNVVTVENISYSKYITMYDSCHIFLDQVYSYDQGYNALEAMAHGKVVFTGAEQEWLNYYGLKKDTVAINALPDAKAIAAKLEWLILNPNEIIKISKNARAFVEREHNYIKIVESYVNTWQLKDKKG